MSTPDVSLKLEHIRHYLVLADEQSDKLHTLVKGEHGKDISNRIGWLLDDLLDMLAEVHETLYPGDTIITLEGDKQ